MYICEKPQILKKSIVILFLLVFSLRPVYYLGCLTYYGLNIDLIIERYCVNKDQPQLHCDGKCFLAQQLNEASDTNEDNSSKFLNSIFESFIPVYISPNPDIKFNKLSSHKSYDNLFRYYNNYVFLFEFNNFKPPIS